MDDLCTYCGNPFNEAHYGTRRTKDHVIPRSLNISGGHVREGLVPACGGCNMLKADMMPSAMRATANEHRKRAATLDRIADIAERLIEERRLMP